MRTETSASVSAGGTALLPGSFSHRRRGAGRAGLEPHHPLCGVCAAGVIGGSAPNSCSRCRLAGEQPFLLSPVRPHCSPTCWLWLQLWEGRIQSHIVWGPQWRNGCPRGTGEAGPETRFRLLGRAGAAGCQQRVVLPHLTLEPAWPFPPHWEPGKLDCVSFPSQVTGGHLTIPQDRKRSSSHWERPAVLG